MVMNLKWTFTYSMTFTQSSCCLRAVIQLSLSCLLALFQVS